MAQDKLERLRSLLEADPEGARELIAKLNSKVLVPHEGGQQYVVDATERFLILCAGRRWGKTKIGAKKALTICRKQGKMVWWVAPTYRVVKRGYAEVLKQLPDNVLSKPAPSEGSFDAGRPVVLHFKNGSKFEFHSAERPEGMLGAAVDYVILDEAATMPRNTWEQIIMPTLADHQGEALLISTPRGRNWFYEMYQRGQDKLQPEFVSWRFPSMSNPTIPQEEWELQKQSLPRVVYEQEILADFVSNAAAVFRFDENDVLYSFERPEGAVVMGIDLAKHQDFTVLDAVNVDTRQPCYHDRFNAVSWPEQRARIARAVKKLKRAGASHVTLVVDSTGVGDPIVDDLELMGYEVVSIKFTQQWKQQAVMLLSSDLEQKHAFLHEAQLPEFQSYTYTITDAGRWTFAAPGGGHDDEVSAKLLQHWEVAKGGSPNMAIISSEVIEQSYANEWDREIDDDEEWFEEESELDKIKTVEIHPRSTTDLLNDPSVWR